MKEALEMMAAYSRRVNENVIVILTKLPEDQLKKDLQTFYKSLFATFSHMTMADINWLRRLEPVFTYSALTESRLLKIPSDELKASLENNYQSIFSLRREVDVLFEKLVSEINAGDLQQRVNYKNNKGDDLSKQLGHILMHLFNHQTHHRGEISALLDIQKISNNYAGLLNYV